MAIPFLSNLFGLFKDPYKQYEEDPYRQWLTSQINTSQDYLEQFKKDRMAEAEMTADEAARQLGQWANVSGFTGTSTESEKVSGALSNIYGQAQRDINQLAAQTDWLQQQNLFAAKQIEQALIDQKKQAAMGLFGEVAGLGANALLPGIGAGSMGADIYGGFQMPQIPWQLLFSQYGQQQQPSYSNLIQPVGGTKRDIYLM